MFVLSLLLSFSVFATEDMYSWIVEDVNHPLWVALSDVPARKHSNDTLIKQLPSLQCVKTTRKPYTTSCKILKQIDPKQAFHIYEALKVAETATNASHVKAKVLGPLIIRADFEKVKDEDHWRYNLSKVYFNHPCQYVHDTRQAKRCMGFWARKIYVSYEDWNEIDMADMFKAKEGIPLITEILSGKEETHRVQELINQFDFFAAVIEYQGRLNMHYLGLKLGADAIPVIIQSVNIEDIPRAVRRQLLEREQREKVALSELIAQFKVQMDDFTEKVILRSQAEAFQNFKANLTEDLEKEFPGPQ